MALGSCTTRRSPRVNTLANPAGELNKLASAQGPARGSNVESNEALTPPEAPTPPFIPSLAQDLFIKFMKVFMDTT